MSVSRLFFQSLDPNWAYSLNTEYLNQIQIRSSSLWWLQPTLSWFLWVFLKSFPSPPPWTWRLFGSGRIHSWAQTGTECNVQWWKFNPKRLVKMPNFSFCWPSYESSSPFFTALFNLILQPIQRKSQKNDGKSSKILGWLWNILFCIF